MGGVASCGEKRDVAGNRGTGSVRGKAGGERGLEEQKGSGSGVGEGWGRLRGK